MIVRSVLFIGVALAALGAYGCSSDSGGTGTEPGVDGGVDGETPPADASSVDGFVAPADGGTPVDASTPVDANTPPDSGRPALPAFGAVCTQDSDCTSMLCEPFEQMSISLCTQSCGDAATPNCPSPSDGTCTPKGYCRFD